MKWAHKCLGDNTYLNNFATIYCDKTLFLHSLSPKSRMTLGKMDSTNQMTAAIDLVRLMESKASTDENDTYYPYKVYNELD